MNRSRSQASGPGVAIPEGEVASAGWKSGVLRAVELRVTPNKHGYLLTGREPGQDTEERTVYRTLQELNYAFRAAGVDAKAISRMERHLERREGFRVKEKRLITARLFPRRLRT